MNAEMLSRDTARAPRRPLPPWLVGSALGLVALLLLILLPAALAPGSAPDAAPLPELPVSA